MAGLTLKQIRNDVRSRVNDEELKLGDGLLNHWINIGQDVVMNKLLPVLSVHPKLTATDSNNLIIGINKYIVPSSCKRIRRLRIKYATDGSFKKAIEKSIDEIDNAIENSFGATTAEPLFLTWANYIEIYPIPTTVVSAGLQIDFIRQKVNLVNDTDISILPEEYQGLLVDYVEILALRKLEKGEQANNNEQIIAQMYSDIIGANQAQLISQKQGSEVKQ